MQISRQHIFPITLLVALAAQTLVLLACYFGWFGQPEQFLEMWCEDLRDGFIKTPANSWSNVGFLISGVYISWLLSHKDFAASNPMTRTTFLPLLYSIIVVLLGPMSFAMHASATSIGGFLDMLSMYLLCSFTFAYGLKRFTNWSDPLIGIFFFWALALCIACYFLQAYMPEGIEVMTNVFALFILLTAALELLIVLRGKTKSKRVYGLYCALSFLAAYGIWHIDFTSWCEPHSLLQPHAIWHLLCALATYFLFQHYATEEVRA